MKRLHLNIFLLFASMIGFGQNLVPNPSFEDLTNCSIDNQIFRTPPWQQPTAGTSDWFNPCTSSPNGSTVPNNDFGNQLAQEGTSYAGFILYANGINYREYIQVALQDSLIAGNKYWVSFFVSLADSAQYAIKEIGALFTNNPVNSSDVVPLQFNPQIVSSMGFLNDKTNWIVIKGTLIANGGEKYMTVGNFQDSTSIDTLNVGGGGIGQGTNYYYIDNICVSSDSTLCGFTTSLKELVEQQINVFPTPFSEQAKLIIPANFFISSEHLIYTLYDKYGALVRKSIITEQETTIERGLLSPGAYLLKINISDNQQYIKKIILN